MIRLPTKQRYATRIMVYLASRDGSQPVRKIEIARAESIPHDYVEQICMKLKAGGLVMSHRGKKGGFSLARDPAKITVADIMTAVDGRHPMAPCLGNEGCARRAVCVTQHLWRKASAALEDVLSGTTVAELAGQARQLAASRVTMFDI